MYNLSIPMNNSLSEDNMDTEQILDDNNTNEWEEVDSDEEQNEDPMESQMRADLNDASLFGLSRTALGKNDDNVEGLGVGESLVHIQDAWKSNNNIQEMPQLQHNTPPPLFKDPVKVTAKLAEQGRKLVREKLDAEQTAEKYELLKRITQYHEYWPDLKETAIRKKFNLDTSLAILKAEVERCEKERSSSNALEAVKSIDAIFKGAVIEPTAIHIFKLPAFGYGRVAKDTQSMLEDEFKELSIKYGHYFGSSVEFRYLMKSIVQLNQVIQANKKRNGEEVISEKNMSNLNKKYDFI